MVQFNVEGPGTMPPRYVLANPLRQLLLSACSRGEVATSAFARQYKQPAANVRYHVGELERAEYVRLSRTEPARNFVRYYYVAARQAVVTDAEFEQMTMKERHGATRAILQEISERGQEARDAGTMASRSAGHLSRLPLVLDLQGWTAVMAELLAVYERSFEIQAEALARLKTMCREEWIPVVLAIAGFESPAPPVVRPGAFFDYPGVSWEVVLRLLARSKAALGADTLDARIDSHLTWSPFIFEKRSWRDLTRQQARVRRRVLEIQAEAMERLKWSGEEPTHTTVALLSFQSPEPARPNEEIRLAWPPQVLPVHS